MEGTNGRTNLNQSLCDQEGRTMKLLKRITTNRMTNANRTNSRKSTGPQTPEGISKASRNAIKHGVLAMKLPPGLRELNEDASEFKQLHDDLLSAFHPSDPFERLLVSDITAIRWRLHRLHRAEAILHAQQKRDAEAAQPGREDTLLLPENDLNRLTRYESHLEHEFVRKVQLFFAWRETAGGALAFPVYPQPALPNEVSGDEGGESSNGEAAIPSRTDENAKRSR